MPQKRLKNTRKSKLLSSMNKPDCTKTGPRGCLYLIPSPLSEGAPESVLPARVFEVIAALDCYVVEEERTARRFLSAAGLKGKIDTLEFHTLNEHSTAQEAEALVSLFDNGRDVGLISEAGLPAVADPGAALVGLCHSYGIRVVPLAGPSSLLMALMASGLDGQCFAFCGYLPAKTDLRRKALIDIERRSAREHQSQIFIETPYRNDAMLRDITECCQPQTRLCIASGISGENETIQTKTVAEWKKTKCTIGKVPTVFILLSWKK